MATQPHCLRCLLSLSLLLSSLLGDAPFPGSSAEPWHWSFSNVLEATRLPAPGMVVS